MDPPSRRPNKHRYTAIQAVVEPSYPRWMRRSISPTRLTDPLMRGCVIINSPCRRIAMATIEAWVAPAAKSSLVRQKVELEPLGDEEVEVKVEHCGLCHSDISIRNNDWGVLAVFGRAGARSRWPSCRSRTSGQGADSRTTRWGR